MNIQQIITIITGIIYFVAFISYITSLLKKKTQAHPVSWLLWSILGAINLFFYRQTGATYTQLLAWAAFLTPTLTFIFSLRNWKYSFSKIDYYCLFLSLLALTMGILYHNPTLGLVLNLIADFIAFIPTIIKTYHNPKSENSFAWSITVLANILVISVINKWTLGIAVLPIYTFIMNSVVLVETLRTKRLS